MRRIALVSLSLFALLFAAGCSGEGDDAGGATETAQTPAQSPPTTPPSTQGRAAIPEQIAGPAADDVVIQPFFDVGGNSTTLAVAPGENFSFYVFAEYAEPFHMTAAQYRVVLPAGVSILHEVKFSDRALTMGSYTESYSMAFECHKPGKWFLVKFNCLADDTFDGGKIEIVKAVPAQGDPYLGFVSCNTETPEKIPANGGSVSLNKK